MAGFLLLFIRPCEPVKRLNTLITVSAHIKAKLRMMRRILIFRMIVRIDAKRIPERTQSEKGAAQGL
jgi:hypothetical protein